MVKKTRSKKSTTRASKSLKTKRNRRKGKKRSRQRKTRSYRWIFHLFIILLLALAAWTLWLDQKVQDQFEGRRWSLPATVYARPLQLYTGQSIKQEDVTKELQLLGYRKVSALQKKGDYSVARGRIHLYSRGFQFVDGTEVAEKIALHFSGTKLQRLSELQTGKTKSLLRLTPLEIGKIYPAHHEDRQLINLESTPPFLIKALLATEDRRFYQHYGVDPRGIARAFWTNISTGSLRQGASTLTQQLAKNFFLTPERTIKRKANELIIAFILEARYSKDEILEAYLNEVFLSQDNSRAIHGFGLASEYFFNGPLNELRPDQLALLVGMVKGPSAYNPRRHPERAKARRDVVLKSMARLNLITASELQTYLSTDLDIQARRSLSRDRYPAFTELVKQQLIQQYDEKDLRESGLRIFTTLDPIVQEEVQTAVKKRLAQFEKQGRSEPGKLQAAVTVTEVKTGELKAVVGSRDNKTSGFNRAIHASRHVGSLIKPIIYLTALESGKSLATQLQDRQVNWPLHDGSIWSPENYEKVYFGDVLLSNALAHSYNAATVNLGQQLGLGKIKRKLKKIGLAFDQFYPASLLGAMEQTPLEVTKVYQAIANDGFATPLRSIRAVATQENQVLNTYTLNVEQVTDQQSAFLLKYAMTEVVRQGTGKSLMNTLPNALPLAGKTGTTGDLRDSWFAGFDQNTLSVVWLGRDDNKPAGLTGASGALRVWTDLMRELPLTPLDLNAPDGIEWHWINPLTGARTQRECSDAQALPFRSNNVPDNYESCDQEMNDDKGFLRGLFE